MSTRLMRLVLPVTLVGALIVLPLLATPQKPEVKRKHVAAAEKVIGLKFSRAERDSLLEDVNANLDSYRRLRELQLPNAVPPALQFNPLPLGFRFDYDQREIVYAQVKEVTRPDNLEELAYYSVAQLGALIRTRQVSSTELTRMYLERLKRYDPQLHCVVTLTEELALRQAARADEELAAGHYRGPCMASLTAPRICWPPKDTRPPGEPGPIRIRLSIRTPQWSCGWRRLELCWWPS